MKSRQKLEKTTIKLSNGLIIQKQINIVNLYSLKIN